MSFNQRIGILGAGQLGKMLAIEAARWQLDLGAMDSSHDVPAAGVVRQLTLGNFNDYRDVLQFGKEYDIIGIEIEHVNTDALRQLQAEGKTIIPDPDILDIIKDKGQQKTFYDNHNIPTSPFRLYNSAAEVLVAIEQGAVKFPFVQKSRAAGYDGRGVAVIQNKNELQKLLDTPSLVEEAVEIDKELAVIVAANSNGEMKAFPVVEMLFNPDANLVENLICPAGIPESVQQQATQLAIQVMKAYNIVGLLAIELFLTKTGELLVNEVAPRPHNSGHHTIEACITSQYQQQLRAYLNLPLGATDIKQPSMMVNVLGAPGYTGPVHYEGVEEVLSVEGVYLHIYGKTHTKPFRKMGHVTITGQDRSELEQKANFVRQKLKVISR